MTTESNKQKIAKIHDIFPLATKDQIAKVLQYYDDDESQALDAITRDGGREAISNWAESVNAKSKNNKNKKKKKKGKKEPGFAGSATASFDADDSSSLHSSGNVDAEVERECPICENKNGVLDSADDDKLVTRERLNVSEIEVSCSAPNSESVVRPEASISSVPDDSKCSIAESENPACASPVSSNSDKQDEPGSKRDKYRSVKDEGHGKYASRQRTNSFRRSKTSSFSEDSATLHNPPNSAAATKRGYEKCKKDLNRQTISLQRIHAQVDKGLEESSKKLKNVFNDLRKMLDQRQEQIEQELAKTKEDALNLLKSRQDLAVELKRRVDRTPSLSETEWSELRLDVKQFVTERKYDDELGKTIWFQWSVDSINESISNFGEVHPVKNVYSQRSHSALSNVMASHNPEPSPSSSVANEEISSAADKNDVANMLDTVEDEIPVVKQEVSVPPPRNQPSENRSRVFSNTKFQINRARGYNRGNRGYGYSRPNNRNNYRNNYGNYEYSDYRNHPHQERDGRIHNNVVFSNDRNMNNHRNNRNDRRGPSMNYRPNVGRAPYRGNMNQQRQNAENYVKTDPGAAENPVENEKSNVMNGYMNN